MKIVMKVPDPLAAKMASRIIMIILRMAHPIPLLVLIMQI
jgi:hypothetical protein